MSTDWIRTSDLDNYMCVAVAKPSLPAPANSCHFVLHVITNSSIALRSANPLSYDQLYIVQVV